MTDPRPLIEVLADVPLDDDPLRVVSYGGGVQSTALLALAAQDKIPHRTFLFANTGDDSEHPRTLRYVRETAMPFAAEHGIELLELQRVGRDGKVQTLFGDMAKLGRRSLPIPVYMWPSGAPASRPCTNHFKIEVTNRWIRDRGATPDTPAKMALGISVDEIQRAKPGVDPQTPYRELEYPLLDLGFHRNPDCRDAITAVGLPIPPKSACYFCPYTHDAGWRDLRDNYPDEWDRTVAVEAQVNEARRTSDGNRNPLYFSSHLKPLPDAIDDQLQLDGMGDDCDSGYCFT